MHHRPVALPAGSIASCVRRRKACGGCVAYDQRTTQGSAALDHACNIQRAGVQHTTCGVQHTTCWCATYNVRCNIQRAGVQHTTCGATYNVPHATHHATSGARCRLVSVLHRHRFLATIKLAANSLGDAEIVQVRPPSRIDSLPYEHTITVPHARPLLSIPEPAHRVLTALSRSPRACRCCGRWDVIMCASRAVRLWLAARMAVRELC